jgi:hypothetical protein
MIGGGSIAALTQGIPFVIFHNVFVDYFVNFHGVTSTPLRSVSN